jgi:hypothetical protein
MYALFGMTQVFFAVELTFNFTYDHSTRLMKILIKVHQEYMLKSQQNINENRTVIYSKHETYSSQHK